MTAHSCHNSDTPFKHTDLHPPDVVFLAVGLAFLEEAGPVLIHVNVALAAHEARDVPVEVRRHA